jgi:hypothetical protein
LNVVILIDETVRIYPLRQRTPISTGHAAGAINFEVMFAKGNPCDVATLRAVLTVIAGIWDNI